MKAEPSHKADDLSPAIGARSVGFIDDILKIIEELNGLGGDFRF